MLRCGLLLVSTAKLNQVLCNPVESALLEERHFDEQCDAVELIQKNTLLKKIPRTASSLHVAKYKTEGLLEIPGNVAETSYTNWFSRLGDSITSVIFGFFLIIPFSMTLLYTNEQRNARYESVVMMAESEVKSINHKSEADAQKDGVLVFMDSGVVQGMDPMADRRFAAMKMDTGCVRMKSCVEAYQWQESSKTETKKDRVGGGETKKTVYEYHAGWQTSKIDSSSFKEPNGHENNLKVQGLVLGEEVISNETVKYGDHHYLPSALVGMLGNWEDASAIVGEAFSVQGTSFSKSGQYFFCGSGSQSNPSIGDMRAKLEYVLDGPGTVLALQSLDKKHEGCATFLPYRNVSRPICGSLSEDELRERLVDEGKKDSHQLANDDMWTSGIFCCLCCCCNLVSCCFAYLTPPEVFHLFPGTLNKKSAFESVKLQGQATKWGCRLVGWVLLYAGTYMLFEPLLVVLDIFPFLGPYISDGVSWVVSVVVLLFTAILATLVVSVAYLRFHPGLGACYLAGIALVVGAIVGITKALS